jgi:Uma2 family endonuclease
MVLAEHLITIEEYLQLPEGRRPTELVRGRVVEFEIGQSRHGVVCGNVGWRLANYVKPLKLGRVCCNDTGVITERNPDTVRGADVCYYSYERVPSGPLPWTYLDIAPNLVFEAFPAERPWPDLLIKVREFLRAGVDAVCVLNDVTRTAQVMEANGAERVLSGKEDLTFPGILPGFCAPVEAFFED